MRALTVPNWSFGRDNELLSRCRMILDTADHLETHFAQGDVDHNRSVLAFSGEIRTVCAALEMLSDLILPRIDLNRHVGVHPRIGALDVCPMILEKVSDFGEAESILETLASVIALKFQVPIYLYEKSEQGRHESDLPSLRHGGFGGLIDKELNPDFGPSRAHPQWGVTVMGIRGFLIAMNANLRTSDPTLAKLIAKDIRRLRASGDERFLGVRALGFPLASRGLSQVSMNLTLPDLTPVDPILEWVEWRAKAQNIAVESFELIGVIRESDVPTAGRLMIRKEQVVNFG